jgi:predicted ATPase
MTFINIFCLDLHLFARMFRRFYGLRASLNLLIESGKLKTDKSQEFAIENLSNLSKEIEASSNLIWSGFVDKPKSIYIYGSVGKV